MTPQAHDLPRPTGISTGSPELGKPKLTPMLQEVFNLDEGPVTLSFPATMSPESYQDLSDYLALFLRKAKRNADVARLIDEVTGRKKMDE